MCKMKATTSLIVLISLIFIIANTLEVESDFDGYQTTLTDESGELVVYVTNSFDFDISVYFDDGKALHYMMDIQANGSGQLNTFHGHNFLATAVGNSEPIAKISILGRVTDYTFRSLRSSGLSSSKKNSNASIHPAVKIIGRPTTATNAKFRSLSGRVLDLYYDNGQGGTIQGTLKSGQDSTTNAYEGHVFFYTPQGRKNEVIGSFTITKDQVLYTLIDKAYPASKEILEYTQQEQAYLDEYRNRTGLHWRSFYGKTGPRLPPHIFMWPAEEIGQIHKVESTEGKWYCSGPADDCQSRDPVDLELFVISQKPRAFIINNFLSDFEADSIINIASPQIRESTVGNNDGGGIRRDSTRTSSNTWIGRHVSNVTESLYLRAAHLLNIDDSLLNVNTNCEEMQVVHYSIGQKYDAHHDWGVSGYAESRFITLLLYLNNMKHEDAGGETSFPKAANGQGIKVHPGKGSAVLFYNLLEDGNADDLALHEAVPVRDGEKWLSNFWVWDPKRK